MTPAEQIERTIRYWHLHDSRSMRVQFDSDHRFFGIIQRKRRLFARGDIVIGRYNNGGGSRWPVTAVSSRGYRVREYYIDFQRSSDVSIDGEETKIIYYDDFTQGRRLVFPVALQMRYVLDPAIRAWLVDEVASLVAPPVATGSGGRFTIPERSP